MTDLNLPNRNPENQMLEPTIVDSIGVRRLSHSYDLIVIGGGINGSGIARDAAERGLTVLLLEKNDFGAGTSAYSSRLIHGGLRYLENLEFDLVYESLRERELLLRNAPHLVRPLPLAIPIYRYSQKPHWKVWLGMLLYDLLSWRKSMPAHCMYGQAEFQQRFPAVNAEQLQGGPVYYDAQVSFPERICVENALAAKETKLATILNHAQVNGFLRSGMNVSGVSFTDTLTDQVYSAQGKVMINASGPWVDKLLSVSGLEAPQKKRIGGTQGSHIVVRQFPQGPQTALYVEARSDGRPFFILPWQEAYYLIGTTDLRFEGDLDRVAAHQSEVDYLLAETNHVLPQAHLSLNDVLYSYAGVRPLPYTEGKKAGKITRKHLIEDHALNRLHPLPGLISVIGGKLTTYRHLAEEVVNYAIKAYRLRLPTGGKVPATKTRLKPLPGGEGIGNLAAYRQHQAGSAGRLYGVSEAVVSNLIDIYGRRFEQVLTLTQENPVWRQPVYPGSCMIGAQVIAAIRYEMAYTIEDVLLRRTACGLDASVGLQALDAVDLLMAQELGWSEERLYQEKTAYRNWVEERNLAFLRQPTGV